WRRCSAAGGSWRRPRPAAIRPHAASWLHALLAPILPGPSGAREPAPAEIVRPRPIARKPLRGAPPVNDLPPRRNGNAMFLLSAFADEIDPDPQVQIDVLQSCGVRHIELRSILKTNVLDLTDLQVSGLKSLLDRHGFNLGAVGSPIGKVKINDPFEPHLKRFRRAVELCKVFGTSNIRVFSYYPAADGEPWEKWRDEVMSRMIQKAK